MKHTGQGHEAEARGQEEIPPLEARVDGIQGIGTEFRILVDDGQRHVFFKHREFLADFECAFKGQHDVLEEPAVGKVEEEAVGRAHCQQGGEIEELEHLHQYLVGHSGQRQFGRLLGRPFERHRDRARS